MQDLYMRSEMRCRNTSLSLLGGGGYFYVRYMGEGGGGGGQENLPSPHLSVPTPPPTMKLGTIVCNQGVI